MLAATVHQMFPCRLNPIFFSCFSIGIRIKRIKHSSDTCEFIRIYYSGASLRNPSSRKWHHLEYVLMYYLLYDVRNTHHITSHDYTVWCMIAMPVDAVAIPTIVYMYSNHIAIRQVYVAVEKHIRVDPFFWWLAIMISIIWDASKKKKVAHKFVFA